MIGHFFHDLMCRFTGRACSTKRPASRDLVSEMKSRSDRVTTETYEIKRHRHRVETGDFLVDVIAGGFDVTRLKDGGEQ